MAGGGTKVVVQAIGGNTFITIIKFIGYFISGSPSLLAEGVHSLADTFNQVLILIGIKQSNQVTKEGLPTGRGNARYVWNLVSAVGIFFMGFGVTFYHGMHALLSPSHASTVGWIGISILIISFIIEFWVFIQALKEVNSMRGERSLMTFLQQSDDPSLVAILLEDGVAVLGVVLALMGILLGNLFHSPMFDIAASLIIAFLMAFMAIALGIMNSKLLIGKSMTKERESDLRHFVEKLKGVKNVSQFSTQIIGAGKVRLSLELEFNASEIIDMSSLEEDAKAIADGETVQKILLKTSERMVRLSGRHINELELEIQKAFPEVALIDFELE